MIGTAARGWAVLAVALALAAPACSSRAGGGDAPGPAPAPAADVSPAAAAPAAPLPDDLEPAATDDRDGVRPDAGTVKIKLLVDPRRQARVLWGRKDLGVAPLEIVRPRGSAPLDLTIQAAGCLALHTRVFTDHDDTLSLRLYTEQEAIGLPGYSPPAPAAPSSPTKTRRQF